MFINFGKLGGILKEERKQNKNGSLLDKIRKSAPKSDVIQIYAYAILRLHSLQQFKLFKIHL